MIDPILPDWPAPPNVHALSTLREGGISEGRFFSLNLGAHVGDRAESVGANRARLRRALRLPAEPVWLAQAHGTSVADLDAPPNAPPVEPPTADAAVTRRSRIVCAILSADCLPVLFCDLAGTRIGAAHAGWRGLADGVLENCVRALSTPPDRLLAWLGPCIGAAHFEVGADVRERFVAADSQAQTAFAANSRSRFMADLPMLARRRLAGLGISRVFGSRECTFADPQRFFSHRRDGQTGRQATLIWRDEP